MKQGWEIKKLGDVCTIERGGSPRPIDAYITDEDNGINWIKIGDATPNSKYITSTKEKIKPEGIRKSRMVYKGDFILSNSMSFGRPYILGVDGCIHDGWLVLRDNENTFDKIFLYYYLSSPFIYQEFKRLAVGGVVNNLNSELVRGVNVIVPPIAEQEKIVAELDCLSGIIEKKKQQLKELDNLAQSIFYEMFGDPVENDKGWEVREVGDVCILKSGDSSANNTSAGMLPYIKVGDMNMEGNNPRITTSSTFVSKEENAKGIFPIGSILFPKRGGAIFTNKKRLTSVEVCCDLNIMGVIPKREVLPIYIYHYFIGLDFGKLCNGATIPQINNKDIAPLKICVPSKNKQQEFASMIESIEKQKELIAQSIKETETLFNSRMDYYFN